MVQNMRIDHGRANAFVAEQFLDGTDVVTSGAEGALRRSLAGMLMTNRRAANGGTFSIVAVREAAVKRRKT
jgi:hypothetical protein